MDDVPLSKLGLSRKEFTSCYLLNIEDDPKFTKSAVSQLLEETAGRHETTISPLIAAKIAEFSVWHIALKGLQIFEEKHAWNTQAYDWLSSASIPGIDIYGAAERSNEWIFTVIEVKWSENCDYNQITSLSKGLLHDLQKLFTGNPSNRLSTHLSALRHRLSLHQDCAKAYHGLCQVLVGMDPETTTGVQFIGFFVSDIQRASKKNGFEMRFAKLRAEALEHGWCNSNIDCYVLTGPDLFNTFDKIARGDV